MNKLILIAFIALAATFATYKMMGNSFNLMLNEIRVTQYEYQECHRALKCKDMQCQQFDTACNEAASRQSSCELGSLVCKNANTDYENMSADEYMTDNYYACKKECGPSSKNKVSATYWDIFECEALCGGVPLEN